MIMYSFGFICGFFIFWCALHVSNADDIPAKLVAVKSILNNFVVVNKELSVQYDILNIGSKAAINVELNEEGFLSEYFRVKSGFANVRWSRIPPGANVTHVLIVYPLQEGSFNSSHATLRYKNDDGGSNVIVAYTTSVGEVSIYSQENYENRFSAHITEWLSFGLLTTPTLLFPLLLWYRSKSKYESLQQHGKKSS